MLTFKNKIFNNTIVAVPVIEKNKENGIKLIEKYPEYIPVIIKKRESDKLLQIPLQTRYLIPKTSRLSEVTVTIRKKMNMDPKQAIFIFVGNGILVPIGNTIEFIYEQYKSDDNFLYLTYCTENTFG